VVGVGVRVGGIIIDTEGKQEYAYAWGLRIAIKLRHMLFSRFIHYSQFGNKIIGGYRRFQVSYKVLDPSRTSKTLSNSLIASIIF
jgi:hypothetical protein